MTIFYKELGIRALALANALQYQNAETLLRLAWAASDDIMPDALAKASAAMTFAWARGDEYDHDQFEKGVALLEKYLETA